MQRTNRILITTNVLLLAVAIVVGIVLSEILVRTFWDEESASRYGYPKELYVPDATKGFVHKPLFVGNFSGPLYKDIVISINSKGLRGPEHDYRKQNESIRILVLGDSVTFGPGVQYEDSYPAQLEEELRNRGFFVEVINAGVSSYEFYQEYIYYFEEGYKYHPDIVILGVVLNDARRVNVTQTVQERFPKERTDIVARSRSFIGRHFKFLKFLRQMIRTIGKPSREDYNNLYFERVYAMWSGDEWNDYHSKLVNLSLALQQERQELVVVIFPFTQQFNNSLQYGTMPQEILTNASQILHARVVDLMPHLGVKNYTSFYLPQDNVHLNEQGNRIVADVLAKNLIRWNLVRA